MNEPALRSTWPIEPGQWRGARPYQEDDYGYVEVEIGAAGGPPAVLMVLADGMGGEVGGATASRCVVEAFMRRIREVEGETERRLDACLDAANRDVRTQVDADPDLEGMGSTVVAAVYDGRSVSWLSVGDSPMWLFTEGRLVRLNADHSMAPILDRMAEVGEITREEALGDRTRHMLRSAVTGSEVDPIDRGRRVCRLEEGDYLLLASDGIETLAEEEIERCLAAAHGGVKATADALLSAVKAAARPHQDNVTFLLLAGEGRAARRTGWPDRVAAQIPPHLRHTAHRGAVAAIFLGAALLLAAMIWWAWPDSPEPDPGDTAPSAPAARSDGTAPESAAPESGQAREHATPAPGPRSEESPGDEGPDTPASGAEPRPEASAGGTDGDSISRGTDADE